MTFLEQIHELITSEAQAVYDELFTDTSLEVPYNIYYGDVYTLKLFPHNIIGRQDAV
jgi:hypothetical protein